MSTRRPVRSKIGLGPITLAGSLLALLLLIIVVYGYTARPGWVGVADKDLWDWLELLIVPLTLALALFFLSSRAQRQRDLEQRELELAIESERAQAEALRAYLDQMSDLLVNQRLKLQSRDSEPITLAQARTLAVLGFLGRTRKAQPLRLVFNLGLINNDDPLLSLKMADLQGADLREISLFDVSLREADFRLADLTGANLRGSDLSWADLRGANLSRAVLINASLAHANLLPYDRDNPDQLERVMNLDENRIEMRIPQSAWFPRDLCFPHS
jgi:hypothetical protein